MKTGQIVEKVWICERIVIGGDFPFMRSHPFSDRSFDGVSCCRFVDDKLGEHC